MAKLFALICLYAVALEMSAQSYQPSYFYTLDYKQVKGKIKFTTIQSGYLTSTGSVPGRIKFKAENDTKVFKITADEIRGFVVGLDSFVVLKNIPVSPKDHFKRDFVKVEEMGTLNLYSHCSQVAAGRFGTRTKKVYFLLKNGTKKMIPFYNRYQQKKFLNLISEDPELAAEVKNDWRWMEKIPLLIKKYNLWIADGNTLR